jgi:hypothetical protein
LQKPRRNIRDWDPKPAESLIFCGMPDMAQPMKQFSQLYPVEEITVSSVPHQPAPPFASLSVAQHQGSGFAQFFLAPFRDVDDRVARLLAAAKTEREARQAAMSAAGEPHR